MRTLRRASCLYWRGMHRGEKIYSYDAAVRCEGAKAEFLSLDGIISGKEFYLRRLAYWEWYLLGNCCGFRAAAETHCRLLIVCVHIPRPWGEMRNSTNKNRKRNTRTQNAWQSNERSEKGRLLQHALKWRLNLNQSLNKIEMRFTKGSKIFGGWAGGWMGASIRRVCSRLHHRVWLSYRAARLVFWERHDSTHHLGPFCARQEEERERTCATDLSLRTKNKWRPRSEISHLHVERMLMLHECECVSGRIRWRWKNR